MSTATIDRIVELWPLLTEEEREKLVEIAESIAEADSPLELSTDEELLLEQARDDFKHGRTISLKDYRAELDEFFDGLRAKSKAV